MFAWPVRPITAQDVTAGADRRPKPVPQEGRGNKEMPEVGQEGSVTNDDPVSRSRTA